MGTTDSHPSSHIHSKADKLDTNRHRKQQTVHHQQSSPNYQYISDTPDFPCSSPIKSNPTISLRDHILIYLSKHPINSFILRKYIEREQKIHIQCREAITKWFHWRETIWLVNLQISLAFYCKYSSKGKIKWPITFQLTLISASDSIVTYLGRDQPLQESPRFELHSDFDIPRSPTMPPANCCKKLDSISYALSHESKVSHSDLHNLQIRSTYYHINTKRITNIRSRLRHY